MSMEPALEQFLRISYQDIKKNVPQMKENMKAIDTNIDQLIQAKEQMQAYLDRARIFQDAIEKALGIEPDVYTIVG